MTYQYDPDQQTIEDIATMSLDQLKRHIRDVPTNNEEITRARVKRLLEFPTFSNGGA